MTTTPSVRDLATAYWAPQPNPYLTDPVAWATDKRGAFLWSRQREILESVRDNRYTAVHSCHDSGKSFCAATAITWWVDSHPEDEVFAVWTAPTYAQVNAIIGRELRSAHAAAGLDGRVTLDDRYLIGDRLVGYGRKPANPSKAAAEGSSSTFQGIHAKYVLVVLDEAGGIDKSLYDAVDALSTNENARVLAIGNPDDPESHFAKVCGDPKVGDGWHVIHVDGLLTPNFTDEQVPDQLRPMLLSRTWVEERRARWGEDSAIFEAKVRGRFSKGADSSMVPARLVARARGVDAKLVDPDPKMPMGPVLGCDIARDGADENVIISIYRGVVEIVARWHEADTTKTAERIEAEVAAHPLAKAVVDGDGLGGPVVDILRRRGVAVVEFRAGQKARHQPARFRNRRAEAWWGLRLQLNDELLSLPDEGDDADDLAADVSACKRVQDADGRTGCEAKDEIRKRLGRSPDLGDALMMAASERPQWGNDLPGERVAAQTIMSGILDLKFAPSCI